MQLEIWETMEFDNILLWPSNAVYNQNKIDRWTMGSILPFPEKDDLGITKIIITLTSIAAKIYNTMVRNHIELKIEKILRKNQNGFWRNRYMSSKILTIRRIRKGVRAKTLDATILFVDFSKVLDFIRWGKMSKYFSPLAFPKKPWQPLWSYIKIRK